MAKKQSQKLELDQVLSLFRSTDELAVPLATGQPMTLLNALNQKNDWQRLEIFTGLLIYPYPILMNPNVYVTSGYYGPIERLLNDQGAHMNYLPANFTGFEIYALKKKFRVVATTLSPPDSDGYLTFGSHGAAIYKPFVAACQNPDQITIAEVNSQMPVVYGHEDYGDNKIHLSQLNYYFETDQTQSEPPTREMSELEKMIAENVVSLIPPAATLQFGIGPTPDHVASLLTKGPAGDFGVHSEMVSDGFLKLFEAGKISNQQKGVFDGQSVFTFAFGSQRLYDFLDERKGKNQRQAVCLPVSIVNDPHWIARNRNFVSINSSFMIDFAGQVCSEAIGLKQYSGVGGQLSFVQGAYEAEGGKSIICLKSTAMVDGKLVSNIVPILPPGSLVSTPRHFMQYVVTEHGVANLYGVPDEERPEKLIAIADPRFRDELTERYGEMKQTYYKG